MKQSEAVLTFLTQNITGSAKHVLIGLNWTAVLGPNGLGLSQTPPRGTSGCNKLPKSGNYIGQPLIKLAHLRFSNNIFERTLAFAAINAYYNRFDLKGQLLNGLDLITGTEKNTVVIGQFPRYLKKMPNIKVIEKDKRFGCYPEDSAEELLPHAEQVLITASTIANGSLSNLLKLSKNAFVILVGPSCPKTPKLFELGINAVSGMVVKNSEKILQILMEVLRPNFANQVFD